MNFNGHCFIKNNISIPKKVVRNYEIETYFTLSNCFFGSVQLTKNPDLDKYKHTGYSIGFNSHSELLFTNGNYGKNVIVFGAGIS